MDAPYSNREIQEFFKDIKESLERIETQTSKTNGRVSKLENWRAYLTGSIVVLSTVVLPIAGWIVYRIQELN